MLPLVSWSSPNVTNQTRNVPLWSSACHNALPQWRTTTGGNSGAYTVHWYQENMIPAFDNFWHPAKYIRKPTETLKRRIQNQIILASLSAHVLAQQGLGSQPYSSIWLPILPSEYGVTHIQLLLSFQTFPMVIFPAYSGSTFPDAPYGSLCVPMRLRNVPDAVLHHHPSSNSQNLIVDRYIGLSIL